MSGEVTINYNKKILLNNNNYTISLLFYLSILFNSSINFQKLNIVPDIWSLNEWNNVLTPVLPGSTNLVKPPVKPYRFDTMFFLCCVDTLPMMVHDKGEMVESKVSLIHIHSVI